jgi:hypothetical protein
MLHDGFSPSAGDAAYFLVADTIQDSFSRIEFVGSAGVMDWEAGVVTLADNKQAWRLEALSALVVDEPSMLLLVGTALLAAWASSVRARSSVGRPESCSARYEPGAGLAIPTRIEPGGGAERGDCAAEGQPAGVARRSSNRW